MKKNYCVLLPAFVFCFTRAFAQIKWEHLSTANGKIPTPWGTQQQTSSLIADINNDGVSDWVIGCRQQAPSLIAFTWGVKGLQKYIIENEFLTIEAGGTFYDIDGDGDQDLVFGGDHESNQVWWWENPYPNLSPEVSWKRHIVKNTGATQHHDQVFGDFKHTGKAQLAFWNQGANTLFMATIPDSPKTDKEWPRELVFSGNAGQQNAWYAEGVSAGDVDGDGYVDLLAGNYWFKYQNDGSFKPIHVGKIGGRILSGKFKPGKTLQVVIAPGDGSGPLTWYECIGDPSDSASWIGHDLAGRDLIHGHALAVADIDGDGNLDIFAAEMAKWSENKKDPDNPNAEAFIFYGDGKGHFRKEIFKTGFGFHETSLADIDGDGDMDILSKPYNWETPRLDIWLQNGTGKRIPPVNEFLKDKTGLELYSMRDALSKDLPSTLHTITSMGIKDVEVSGFYGWRPPSFKKELDKADLKATSMILPYQMFKDSLTRVIELCRLFGVHYVGVGWIPHDHVFSRQSALMAIDLFNEAGAALKQAGLHFFYHPHGYEFSPSEEGTLFDLMASKMQPGIADFQLDIFWATRGGADATSLLKKYPGRFISIHLKDIAKGTPTGDYSGAAPDTSSVVLGKGQVKWDEVLKAALHAGVQYYYIEEENPDAIHQVPESLKYLSGLK